VKLANISSRQKVEYQYSHVALQVIE